jgi:hypothetical protein
MNRRKRHTDPWAVSELDFPRTARAWEKLAFLARYALLAPSTRNTQPWKFRAGVDTVEIFIDPSRWAPIADADQREMHISAGCALENLLIAAAHFHYAPTIEYLPDPNNTDLVVRVRFRESAPRRADERDELFAAITRRSTNHGVYDGTPLGAPDLATLGTLCVEPDLRVVWITDKATRARANELVMRAAALLLSQPAYRQELGEIIGTGAFGNRRLIATLGRFAVSYLMSAKSFARADRRTLASSPALGVICAQQNTRAAQIRAGQVLERIYLAATGLRLCLQPVSQPLETAETRTVLTALLPAQGGIPLQPFRLGRATARRAHTPRRGLDEVLL